MSIAENRASGHSNDDPESELLAKNDKFAVFRHIGLLTWKNALIHRRSWKSTVCQLVSPFVLCFILFAWQLVANSLAEKTLLDPPIFPVGTLPKCIPATKDDNCTTLGIAMIGSPTDWTDHVVNYIQTETGYKVGQEIQYIYNGTDVSQINKYLLSNPNSTQIVLLFCTSFYVLNIPTANGTVNFTINCTKFNFPPVIQLGNILHYQIISNSSLYSGGLFSSSAPSYPKDILSLSLKVLVDNALLSFYAVDKSNPPQMTVSYQDYPHAPNRFFQGYDVISAQGALYFFIAPMMTFIILIGEIVREKELRLREGLQVVGVSPFAYWFSWLITSVAFSVATTLCLQISGYIFRFDFFSRSPFFLIFLVFFCFSMSMQFLMFWLCTLISSSKYANTLSYGFLLFAIVIQLFLSNRTILLLLFSDAAASWVKALTKILTLYPPFNFSKIIGDISSVASNHFDATQLRWINGTDYYWSDYTASEEGPLPTGDTYHTYSSFASTMLLVMDMGIFLILAWYFDHVIAANRGTGARPYFFLTPVYWGCKKRKINRKITSSVVSRANLDEEESHGLDSAKYEKMKVVQRVHDNIECKGVRIAGLAKTYRRYPFGITSDKDVHAVRGVYLEVEEGELLGLLGHNGAGKTTLIGMMTGILEPTAGQANLAGKDLVDDIDEVRRIIGVCPQFDILWKELTAGEHLYLFARIRNIPPEKIEDLINQKLDEVNLANVRKSQVMTFSGGMKRRLSMAICTIGNPKIIFLDEPTTGMDPKSRREVWDLIEKLKTDRVMILTTHAMEEADLLSDRIAVIVDGQFSCVGTPLALKNTYGQGYKVSVIIDPKDSLEVKELIRLKMPSAIIIDESGGSIVFAVPLNKINELRDFFRVIESKEKDELSEKIRGLIKDWALSHSTLEEVFMRVTGKKSKKKTD